MKDPKTPRPEGKASKLTKEQEIELSKLIEGGDELAREKLILANQGLIGRVLQQHFRGFIHLWDDLFQEGQIGLIKAVQKFDWRRGYRFSSYAVWWIRRDIQLALGRWWSGAVRLPESKLKEIRLIKLIIRELEDRLGHHPTPEEIAREVGVSLETVYNHLKTMASTKWLVSLDSSPINDERCIMSVIADEENPSPEQEWIHMQIQRIVRISLTQRQKEVILLRYGISSDDSYRKPLSQKEIAKQLDISPQAVARLEQRALDKIRAEIEITMKYLRREE